MIRGIHYFSTELKTKIDVIPRSCFKYHNLKMLKIKYDINQQDLKTVDLHFVKSE